MHLTALTSVAAAVTGTVAVVATGAILAFSPTSDKPAVWFDFPVAAGTIYSGPVVVSAHTNVPKATAISVTLSQDGAVVTALTDSSLDRSGSGAGADILLTASSDWDAPVGVYDVVASVYAGSKVVQEGKSELTVIAFNPHVPSVSPTTEPSASPAPSASATASAEPSPTASDTPDPAPSATATTGPTEPEPPQATPTPKPPTPKPPKTTPTPEPTAPPLAGSVTRVNASASGWTNTFAVTGFRPQGAQVFVDIRLHNERFTPYYNAWQSYPCGTPIADTGSGSGPNATYHCAVRLTIEPPSNWTNGEFGTFMPDSEFRSKVIYGGQTYYGTGGTWSPTNGK